MTRFLLIVVFGLLLPLASQAQEMTWKQHVKTAEKLIQKRAYAEAANHYEEAWRAKPTKTEFIYKAGECYYLVRDFKSAANAYSKIKEANDTFDYVGLKYARCLKQMAQYDAASREFVYFINAYKGQDRGVLSDIVHQEILGCELGIKEQDASNEQNLIVEHLSDNVNTIEPEFAPIAFSDDILYFSSLKLGKAKIFRSQRTGDGWSKAQLPRGFSKFKDEHFCNGSFSPDYSRFYFTICNQDQAWGGLTSRCEIYVTKRVESNWTNPQRLPDVVNEAASTNTHPYSVIEGDTEVLYFSSNRKAGRGGMDLWYTTRSISGSDTDFGAPVNCGVVINTIADEITPFYDVKLKELYFSSNGHISVGGYDIFHAKGEKGQFEKVKNIGMPINSEADDNYYVHLYEGTEGFFVSNRTFGMEKITTTQEDIFMFGTPTDQLMVRGSVFDKNTSLLLEDVEIALYEKGENGFGKLLSSKNFQEGTFSFTLIAGKNYELRAEKGSYTVQTVSLNTFETDKSIYNIDLLMEIDPRYENRNQETASVTPVIMDTPPIEHTMEGSEMEIVEEESVEMESTIVLESMPETVSTPSEATIEVNEEVVEIVEEPVTTTTQIITAESPTYPSTVEDLPTTIRSTSATTPIIVDSERTPVTSYSATSNTVSTLPRVIRSTDPGIGAYETRNTNTNMHSSSSTPSGTYYKIQLIAVKTYNADHSRYRPVKGLARIDTEYVDEKDVTRVLLSDFFSETEAYEMLESVQERGFERAYIVRYKDGQRMKRIR